MPNDHTALLEVLAKIKAMNARDEITPELHTAIRRWLRRVHLVLDRG